MPYTIPNTADAEDPTQAQIDARDFADIIAAGFGYTGVISGCAVTAQGTPDMTLAVAAGTVVVGGTAAQVTAGNVTITANASGNPRFDLVCVDSAGVKSVVAGTAATAPVFPNPAGKVVLAAVRVPNGAASINNAKIVDKRVINALTTLNFGVTADTSLYRSGAGVLATPGDIAVDVVTDSAEHGIRFYDINSFNYGGISRSGIDGYLRIYGGSHIVLMPDVTGKVYFSDKTSRAVDTNLYRFGVGWLNTDGILSAVNFRCVSGVGGGAAFNTRAAVDTSNRFILSNYGVMTWGDGAGGAMDTTFYRPASGTLKTDGDFQAIGRFFSGVAAGTGGIWVAQGASQFIGSKSATEMGLYNGNWAAVLDTAYAWRVMGNVFANVGGANDAQRMMIGTVPNGKPGITFAGPDDTYLYRDSANVLKTDGSLLVAGDFGGYKTAYLYTTNGNAFINAPSNAPAGYVSFGIAKQGDAHFRFYILDTGAISWGAGGSTTAPDTNLYRMAADTLKTDDNFVVGGPNTYLGNNGAGAAIYFGNAGDTNLYRSAADTLATDDAFEIRNGFFYPGANMSGLFPKSQSVNSLGAAIGWNFTGGQGEVNFWNTYTSGGGPMFQFRKLTGASTSSLLATINADGSLALPGTNPSLLFGSAGDTNLYRGGTDLLRTDDAIQTGLGFPLICNGGSAGAIEFAWHGSNRQYRHRIVTQHVGGAILGNAMDFHIWTSADSVDAVASTRVLRLEGDGKLWIGNASDTCLYRRSQDNLQTDDTFWSFQNVVTNGIVYFNSNLAPRISSAGTDFTISHQTWAPSFVSNGPVYVDYTNAGNRLYFGSDTTAYFERYPGLPGIRTAAFIYSSNYIQAPTIYVNQGWFQNYPSGPNIRASGNLYAVNSLVAGEGGDGNIYIRTDAGVLYFGEADDVYLARASGSQINCSGHFGVGGQWIFMAVGNAGINVAQRTQFYEASPNAWYNYAGGYGTHFAAAFSVQSDRKLKTEIKRHDVSVDKLLKAGVYKYKRKGSDEHHLGLMADELPEDVIQVGPHAGDEADETTFVDLYKLTTALVATVQHLDERLQAIEKK